VGIYPLLSCFVSKTPYCEEDLDQDVFDEQKRDFRYPKKAVRSERRSRGYEDIFEQDQTIKEITFFFQPTTRMDLQQS
jgi:hypothetical protein